MQESRLDRTPSTASSPDHPLVTTVAAAVFNSILAERLGARVATSGEVVDLFS
jgi:hypothetical protein